MRSNHGQVILEGLPPGERYDIRIRTTTLEHDHCRGGRCWRYGPHTGPIATVTAYTVPGSLATPSGLTAEAGDSRVTLKWSLDDYEETVGTWEIRAYDEAWWQFWTIRIHNTQPPYVVRPLVNGETYYFRVKAVNPRTESELSDSVRISLPSNGGTNNGGGSMILSH